VLFYNIIRFSVLHCTKRITQFPLKSNQSVAKIARYTKKYRDISEIQKYRDISEISRYIEKFNIFLTIRFDISISNRIVSKFWYIESSLTQTWSDVILD